MSAIIIAATSQGTRIPRRREPELRLLGSSIRESQEKEGQLNPGRRGRSRYVLETKRPNFYGEGTLEDQSMSNLGGEHVSPQISIPRQGAT